MKIFHGTKILSKVLGKRSIYLLVEHFTPLSKVSNVASAVINLIHEIYPWIYTKPKYYRVARIHRLGCTSQAYK